MRGERLTEGIGDSPNKRGFWESPKVNPGFFNSQSFAAIQPAEEYDNRKIRYNFGNQIFQEPAIFVSVFPYGKTEDKYDLIPFIPSHLKGE